jgi:transcriptional regulator with GAF, ATPase, and Fis domain
MRTPGDDAEFSPSLDAGIIAKIALPLRHQEFGHALQQVVAYREHRHLDGQQRPIELFRNLVGSSAGVRDVRRLIDQVADTEAKVLILGESGTGKEVVARNIHYRSSRRYKPFVPVNCGAIPSELLESELFGHEKGAFTGAIQLRRGRFELADGGTLFLDEVGELPLETQPKLLRVLQEREFERVGGARSLRADVRVVAATNRDLHAEVRANRFRADLYFRLDVFPIVLPPLRERRDDVPHLLRHFASRTARRLGRAIDGLSPAFIERARAYDWPGNIRELENLVERALIMTRGGVLDASELFAAPAVAARVEATGDGTLEEVERAHISRVLEETSWTVEGDRGAARRLGLNPSTLRGRMRKLGIRKTR